MYLSNMAVLGIHAKLQVRRWCWFDQLELECFDGLFAIQLHIKVHKCSPICCGPID